MKGRRFLAMLCAVMIFVMSFNGIPALAYDDLHEHGPSETVEAEPTHEEADKKAAEK